jgi:uncharacterized protein DUF5648
VSVSHPFKLGAGPILRLVHSSCERQQNTRSLARSLMWVILLVLTTSIAVTGPAQAMTRLYRLGHSSGLNMITSSQTEYSQLVAQGWLGLGTIGWVCGSSTEVPGLVPLYRLFNAGNGDHLFTLNESERQPFRWAGLAAS